jgi:hypothetical protein
MDFWTMLDLRLRHALRGEQDRYDGGSPSRVVIPTDFGVRVLDWNGIVRAVEDAVKGEVE